MKYDQIKELLEEQFRKLTGVKKVTFKKKVGDLKRNRRKRFGLRFNLIAGIHNLELSQ